MWNYFFNYPNQSWFWKLWLWIWVEWNESNSLVIWQLLHRELVIDFSDWVPYHDRVCSKPRTMHPGFAMHTMHQKSLCSKNVFPLFSINQRSDLHINNFQERSPRKIPETHIHHGKKLDFKRKKYTLWCQELNCAAGLTWIVESHKCSGGGGEIDGWWKNSFPPFKMEIPSAKGGLAMVHAWHPTSHVFAAICDTLLNMNNKHASVVL